MSLQRAVINCNLCYKFVKQGYHETNPEVISARNRALEALENIWHMGILAEAQGGSARGVNEFREALDACMNCTFKCPGIARVYDESGAV